MVVYIGLEHAALASCSFLFLAAMDLLKTLCELRSVSGDERPMRDFLIQYVSEQSASWKCKPQMLFGDPFQDCLILIFGEPRTAIYAHIDTIGFTSGYGKSLIRIGGPSCASGFHLWGADGRGEVRCKLVVDEEEHTLAHDFDRELDRGTLLSFAPDFIEDDTSVQCCYLDNRLGIYNALQVAEQLEHGAIVFSTYEEHGGGMAGFIAGYLFQHFGIRQALISDITWVTDGVTAGGGVAISMRDSGIPRKQYLNRIVELAKAWGKPFQLEVESAGGSDGSEIQKSPFPIDWCFIGAAEDNVHTPFEKVHKDDIQSMIDLYNWLMQKL